MDVYQRRRLVALSAIAVIFIVFVLLIRSCGGDDETTPVTPVAGATGTGGATVLTQDDFITEADAICLESNTALANVDETDPVQAANDKAQIVAGELQQLQTLPPPDDGTDKLEKFLNELEKAAAAYQDLATASDPDRADATAISELEVTIDDAFTDAGNAADKFGFKACGDLSKVGEADTGDTSGSTTDTGDTAATTTPVAPTETTPVVPAPTDDTGTVTPPADDTGTDDSSSGGVSP